MDRCVIMESLGVSWVVVVKWQRWWYNRWLCRRSRIYQSFSQMIQWCVQGLKRLKKGQLKNASAWFDIHFY
nr:hypothetical protein [Tanacetum cinerariifolium]